MKVRDLSPEQIASILYDGSRYGTQPSDIFWFIATKGGLEITAQPTGDYTGEKLHIHMRPRQDPIIRQDKLASSPVAFNQPLTGV